eukprot:s225_g45.t1
MSLDPTELAAELQALESQVRALRIRVEAAIGSGTPSNQEPPSSSPSRCVPWTAEWVEQLRQAVTPEALLALDLSPLSSLSNSGHLGSAPPSWTGTSRLARAFREGVLAKQRLDSGDFTWPSKAELFLSTKYHIVLFCPEKPAGFWTWSESTPQCVCEFSIEAGSQCISSRSSVAIMARRAVREEQPLAIEFIRQSAGAAERTRASATVLTDSSTASATWRSAVFLVKCREQGFMAVFPKSQELADSLNAFVVGPGEDAVILPEVTVDMVSARGRVLEPQEVWLADIPWSYLGLFRKGPGKRHLRWISFTSEGVAARPVASSVDDAAAGWVHSMLSPETADEYATAFEAPEEDLDGTPLSDAPQDSGPVRSRADEVFELQTQLAELRSLVEAQNAGREVQGRGELAGPRVPGIFEQSPGPRTLSNVDLVRLQQAAGPPPRRLGRTEMMSPVPNGPAASAEEVLGAEEDRGVVDMETEQQQLTDEVHAALGSSSDPMHKMLLLQLKQTTDLVRALTGRQHPDPLTAMLSGSDSASGSSGGSGVSVKGYAAREMFLKQLQDDVKISEVIKANAKSELGLGSAVSDSALLKLYLEQRVPLGDHKTFAQMGYILASGWETGVNTGNTALMAFCGRMMIYIEQACLDGGRTSLAWLLTGLAEPNFQQLALNRKRSTLTPFSRLAPPPWVAANVGYLKDIEHFESKLRTLGVNRPPNQPGREADLEGENKPKPKPKKPKGGKGAKGDAGAEASQPSV